MLLDGRSESVALFTTRTAAGVIIYDLSFVSKRISPQEQVAADERFVHFHNISTQAFDSFSRYIYNRSATMNTIHYDQCIENER